MIPRFLAHFLFGIGKPRASGDDPGLTVLEILERM